MTLEGKRWLSAKETGEYLGIASKSVYDLVAADKLPAARIGRMIRIDRQRLDADLERQVDGGPARIPGKGRRGR